MNNHEAQVPFLRQLRGQVLQSAQNDALPERRRLLIASATASLAVVALAALLVFQTLLGGDAPSSTPRIGSSWPGPRFGVSLGHPLVEGERVSASLALTTLETHCAKCAGDKSSLQIREAYVDPGGGVGLVLTDGTWIVATPDQRSSATYVDDMKPVLDDPAFAFKIVDLRGHQALATDETPAGPAAVLWVEGGYLFEVLGSKGATANHLIGLSEGL